MRIDGPNEQRQCKRGHLYKDGDVRITSTGKLECKACRRIRDAQRYKQQKAAAQAAFEQDVLRRALQGEFDSTPEELSSVPQIAHKRQETAIDEPEELTDEDRLFKAIGDAIDKELQTGEPWSEMLADRVTKEVTEQFEKNRK